MLTKNKVFVTKSTGKKELFSRERLSYALRRASLPEKNIKKVVEVVESRIYDRVPTSEIREWVIQELDKINKKYSSGFRYKKRKVWVVGSSQTHFKDTYQYFIKQRITSSLIKETGINKKLAEKIADKVEHFLIENNVKKVSGPLIREITNRILLEENLEKYYIKYQKIGLSIHDITKLISAGEKENANLQYNPETIHKLVADDIFRKYALNKEFPSRISDAHLYGQIHIHDLEYFPTRPFCFSHDLRFFLKNGLKADGIGIHTAFAGPAKRASVAINHATKVLASSQTNCAGGQGFNWFNIIIAPYLKGLSYKEIKQLAQAFIYEIGMMYVSRGGQVVFSSIDIEPKIPKTLANIPAVLPGGIVKEKITYSDFYDEAKKFFNAIIDVYTDGDYIKKPFNWPKPEIKIYKNDFKDCPDEIFKVNKLAAKFGTPYFFIQQDYLPEYCCYQCCSYLMPLSDQNNESDLYNGTVRGGAIQVVTINLPQLAYEARGNDSKLFELLRDRMEKARDVILIKREIIRKRIKQGLLPFLSQPVDEKKTPYFLVDKQGGEIGMIGLNEMLKIHLNHEMHESDKAWEFGLRVINEMKKITSEFREKTGYLFGLSRTPAESAAYRLARIDLKRYGNKAFVQGNKKTDSVYYTNSFHLRPSANVNLIDRIEKEAAFHPLMDGGAMSHIWLGEGTPDPEAITKLTERIAKKTLMNYFAYTRDLTVCNDCLFTTGGMLKNCPKCGSKNIDWLSRITGYYQKVSSWNKGKRQELMDRKRYQI